MAAKVPASLKPIAHYIKIANENSSRDPVVYYCYGEYHLPGLFYAVQTAMQLDKSSPEALQFLTGLLSTLETIKKQLAGTEAISNEVVAQAHLENFALKLFNFADAKEKAGQIDKSVVHAFYTAGHVMDVLALFGEVDEPFLSSKKYAKWKSTQIFACLKDGTPYVPSSQQEHDDVDDVLTDSGAPAQPPASAPTSTHPGGGPPTPVEYRYPEIGSGPSGNYQPQYPGGPSYPPRQPQQPQVPLRPQQPGLPQSNYASASLPNMPDPTLGGERKPSVEAFNEARKYTKYALSAIDYEDTRAVVENLRKALSLMENF
ncbi:hypothetical protein OESDEN_10345 [Oesophagostomum dentatum]|uniref:Uncharacterized protein n=1 Tax=Oesophagostomum dentatum TaxID=61180 RepID=A0A0B1SXW3_OESDE|nr:hypothetical protein OESDEN_10345 [Oesophagostomum dentatum]